jgi:hypothetical protein
MNSSGIKMNSVEKMLFNSTCIEILISLYWLFNGAIFSTVQKMVDHCVSCFFSSILSIFVQNFHWFFFACSLHNLLCFIEDPIKEQGFETRQKWYFIISSIVTALITYFAFQTNIFGISVNIHF